MEDFIKVTVRFDESNLLPAMALATTQHQTAVQRTLTPLIYDVLKDLFRRAERESRFDERGLVRRFQEALRNVDEWDEVRRRLLIQLLTTTGGGEGVLAGGYGVYGGAGDAGRSNYVVDLNTAFYSRMHVLCASTPDLAPLFSSNNNNKSNCFQSFGGNADAVGSFSLSSAAAQQHNNNRKQPSYRVQADCTPSTFVFAVCQSAANYFCDDPFLFMHNVPAEQFIERRKRCLSKIDRVVEQVLYDRVTAMVSRLRRELQFSTASTSAKTTRRETAVMRPMNVGKKDMDMSGGCGESSILMPPPPVVEKKSIGAKVSTPATNAHPNASICRDATTVTATTAKYTANTAITGAAPKTLSRHRVEQRLSEKGATSAMQKSAASSDRFARSTAPRVAPNLDRARIAPNPVVHQSSSGENSKEDDEMLSVVVEKSLLAQKAAAPINQTLLKYGRGDGVGSRGIGDSIPATTDDSIAVPPSANVAVPPANNNNIDVPAATTLLNSLPLNADPLPPDLST